MELRVATVLMTGATGGIGTAVADELSRRGARLVLSGRNVERLTEFAARQGGRAVPVDLRDAGAAAALGEAAGPVDVLVHCAGVGWRGPVDSTDVERLVQVNLTAPLALTAA